MSRRKLTMWVCGVGVVAALNAGCATKGYVRSQVDELRGSVDSQMSQMQQEVAEVRNSSDQALARAEQAFGAAGESRDLALGNAGFNEVTRSDVRFAFNSDELSGEAQGALDQLATQIMDRPDLLVDIYGFTDSRGSDQYNYDLGQRRANAALRYLAGRTPGQLHRFAAVSFGKDPDEVDSSREGRAQARRAVVSLIERVPLSTRAQQPSVTEIGEKY